MARIDLTHRHRLRIIYAQTDRMNVVYYSRYYEFFEAARSALLRHIQVPYAQLEREGYLLPVVESHCRYHQSATFEDLLIIESHLEDEPLVKLRIAYQVFKEGQTAAIATGYTVHSFVNREMKPVRAPDFFLAALHKYAGQLLEDYRHPGPQAASRRRRFKQMQG